MRLQYPSTVLIFLVSHVLFAQAPLYPPSGSVFGHAFAGSTIDDGTSLGGFGRSSNMPFTDAKSLNLSQDALYIFVETESDSLFEGQYAANIVYLVNQSELNHAFPAADSRLHLFAEVLHEGEWKAVESMPLIRCGNSYHRVVLGANHYWKFVLPKYGGEDRVKMRYKVTLTFGETLESEPHSALISPEFEAFYSLKLLNSHAE